jgi:hypothetical protein
LTGSGESGFTVASMLRESPAANGPLWRSELSVAGPGLKSIFDASYGSAADDADDAAVDAASMAVDGGAG